MKIEKLHPPPQRDVYQIAVCSMFSVCESQLPLLVIIWFVNAVGIADAIISLNCAGVVGILRVGSVTVLAITLNVVGADEEEEDKAPELFLPLRVAIRRDSSSESDM